MFRACRVAAARAFVPIAGACFVFLLSVAGARAEGLIGGCGDAADIAVLAAPLAPWTGAPLRLIVAADKPVDGELSLIAPGGRVALTSRCAPCAWAQQTICLSRPRSVPSATIHSVVNWLRR